MEIGKQISCIEREIGMRERVYPIWVERKKMSQQKADEERKAMREVLKTLNLVRDLYFGLCQQKDMPPIERIYDVEIETIHKLMRLAKAKGFANANDYVRALEKDFYIWK